MKTGFYYNGKTNSVAVVAMNRAYKNIFFRMIYKFKYKIAIGSFSNCYFANTKYAREKILGYEYIGKFY